jgi:hypothetical protein
LNSYFKGVLPRKSISFGSDSLLFGLFIKAKAIDIILICDVCSEKNELPFLQNDVRQGVLVF